MKHYGFAEKDVEPSIVYAHLKQFLSANGFKIDSESSKANFWDLRASKRDPTRIVRGAIRDADVIVAGTRGRFEIQFRLGVWGRDLALPVVEGIVTLGAATALDLREEHELESKMWESVVHLVDPSLEVCRQCGSVFGSAEELKTHQEAEARKSPAEPEASLGGRLMEVAFTNAPVTWI